MLKILMDYIMDLFETIKKQPFRILKVSLLVWASFPIVIFGIWGIIEVILYKHLNSGIFIKLFQNAMIPWWVSPLMNFNKFLLEYSLFFILISILIHHEILEA